MRYKLGLEPPAFAVPTMFSRGVRDNLHIYRRGNMPGLLRAFPFDDSMRSRFHAIMQIKPLLLATVLCLLPGHAYSMTYRDVALDVPFALHAHEAAAIGPALRVAVAAIDPLESTRRAMRAARIGTA